MLPRAPQVAIEVEYPNLIMCNAPDVLVGSEVWRRRMLKARGWEVVTVSRVAWGEAERAGSAELQRALLHERFRAAGVPLPSES